MKFATFDLEITDDIPEGKDWKEVRPLGISCAGIAWSENKDQAPKITLWEGKPRLTGDDGKDILSALYTLMSQGYTIVTWNGSYFDFPVLLDLAGSRYLDQVAQMNLEHVDLMLMVTFTKGYYLSLQAALLGAGIEGKLKHVTLKDGTVLDDMGGAKAPALWMAGEHEAVLEYLRSDVTQPLELAYAVEERKVIRWTSNRGNRMTVPAPKLLTVRECFSIPKPNTSWMTDPPKREQFVDWMPYNIQKVLCA